VPGPRPRRQVRLGRGRLGDPLTALVSPFWIGGALRAAPEDWAGRIAAAGVYVNPFYAVTGALAESAKFIWHQAPVLYRITRLGDYAPAPAPAWYAPVPLFSAAAAILIAAAMLRRPRAK
jgi:hypothetical protein